jgi:membrane associated rhomboid family serine protease
MSEAPLKPPYRLRRPGGEIDPNRVFNVPGVVLTIVGVTSALFVLMVIAPERAARFAEFAAAVSPQRFSLGAERNGGLLRMLSPLIAHMFVHANLPHLLFNMLTLLAFGAPLARRMGAEGALKSAQAFYGASLFLSFYLLSGIAGALAFIGMHINETTFLVGASGGISGLFGGLVRFAFNRTSLLGAEYARFSSLFSKPVLLWSFFFVVSNVIVGLFGGPLTGGARIAWEAHLGGYFFGLLTYPFFERLARSGV